VGAVRKFLREIAKKITYLSGEISHKELDMEYMF
jgi:hypothetical protein